MDHILGILHEEEEEDDDIDMHFPRIYDPEKYYTENDDNYDEDDIRDLHDKTDSPRPRLHHRRSTAVCCFYIARS